MTLPPDLARLGDELVAAARRTTHTRRARRRRLALAAVTGAMAFLALSPAALEPSHRNLALVAADSDERSGCDRPRGARPALAACETRMILNRPYAIN
jgi:hypothetical protein